MGGQKKRDRLPGHAAFPLRSLSRVVALRLARQRVMSLIVPLKLSSEMLGPPVPVLKYSSLPGVYLLVRVGSGPILFWIDPEKVDRSKEATRVGSIVRVMVPLIVSISRLPSGPGMAWHVMSPALEVAVIDDAAVNHGLAADILDIDGASGGTDLDETAD